VFGRTDVAGQIAAHLPTDSGLTAGEVAARVEALTDRALGLTEAVPIGRLPRAGGVTVRVSDARYATAEVLHAESRILSLAARGRAGSYGRLAPTTLATTPNAEQPSTGQPNAEQPSTGSRRPSGWTPGRRGRCAR